MTNKPVKLIVNGDDLGYCIPRDCGIIESFLQGMITSTSLLVNGQSAQYAIKACRKHAIPIGLHANLTEGKPVNDYNYKTLTDHDNLFWGKFGFRERLTSGDISLAEVEHEIEAQVVWFINHAKQLPTHVDGHQHCHVLPGINNVFASVISKFDIRWTRMPVEKNLESCNWLTEAQITFYTSVVHEAISSKSVFENYGVKYTNYFGGLSLMGINLTKQRIIDWIDQIINEKANHSVNNDSVTCELMVHPGYPCKGDGGCGQPPDSFSKSPAREHEMEMMKDRTLRTLLLRKCDFVSYKTLQP
ncbi:uncharacterized protein TRIADDRAFT_26517 [Trichoplax adhaerens]|uniref:Carbohydrate deacetylase n=1 Tax=Trichoplax adhaerens TaxID=10228 RepID=B3RYZ6_TRIAD|nr:hypothetical protein TRIADDRAFT_26517 [Trichoplax adhaerens]EDV24113.1 hypothetical protein TRIADDRAFT_26517 [Trichoplax adhaerens]|eukprot:XP_002113639.1 hypothetical protein TRIADDRAFT_26517 [Trichoplax adhaerens]